jgi:hypothetical protein
LIYNKNNIELFQIIGQPFPFHKFNIFVGLGGIGMDSLLLVFIFSGLCLISSLGISLFILAACIQSSRISKLEGIDEVHLTVQSRPAAADTLNPQLSESLS